jgi:hypothetical protein
LEFDATEGKEDLVDGIIKKFPEIDEDGRKAIENLMEQHLDPFLGKRMFLEANAVDGFVTRAGAKFKFPTTKLTIELKKEAQLKFSDLDGPQISADLVRVVVEAIGDSLFGVPAVEGASGTSDEITYPLPVFDASTHGVTNEQFVTIDQYAAMSEGLTSSITAQLVRGAGWLALNNEAFAACIETFVGVIARKATEKIAWSYYRHHGESVVASERFDGSTIAINLRIHGSTN